MLNQDSREQHGLAINNSDEEQAPIPTVENEFHKANIANWNAQYASEDIENPRDKHKRRVYFRNVLEDSRIAENQLPSYQSHQPVNSSKQGEESIESQDLEERVK